jgi:hypothetical protein
MRLFIQRLSTHAAAWTPHGPCCAIDREEIKASPSKRGFFLASL